MRIWPRNCPLFTVIKIVELKQFFKDFIVRNKSSKDFLASYLRVPYNSVPYKNVQFVCHAELRLHNMI